MRRGCSSFSLIASRSVRVFLCFRRATRNHRGEFREVIRCHVYFTDTGDTGKFFCSLCGIILFVEKNLAKVHIRKRRNKFFISLLRNLLIWRKLIHMLTAWQERKSAKHIPVFIQPMCRFNPFLLTDRDGHGRIMLSKVLFDELPVLKL